MNIQLIQGEFETNDAIEIISKLIQSKIKFHENKISSLSNEEDIKYRESRIIKLQKELYDLRHIISGDLKTVKVNSMIEIEK